MDCIYLHGFASGPLSEKAVYFSRRLREKEFDVVVPDLNLPTFEQMTVSSQLKIVEALLAGKNPRSVLLVGSSMGGLLSTMLSTKHESISGLVLLAPGFGLDRRWQSVFGEGALETWREQGFLEVHHYAYDRVMPLAVSFLDDALKYQTDKLRVSIPTLVVHGKQDDVVPVEESIAFAELNPDYVNLHVVDDDHFLQSNLDASWDLIDDHICQMEKQS